MSMLLLVYRLAIQSSYQQDSEAQADDQTFDTVQFFITDSGAWRIRTFSVDEDVHVYSLGEAQSDTAESVAASTEKTYGDVIAAKQEFRATDIDELKQALQQAGWSPTLKHSKQHGFAFWVPEGTDYRTKSTPEA